MNTQLGTKKRYSHADLRNRHYTEWLCFLKQSESWSADELRAYQWREVQRIFRHAYETCPGYRERYDCHGITPDSLRTLADFARVPMIDKESLSDDIDRFSTRIRGSKYVTTGGSTGIPFGFYRDAPAFAKELASKAHQYHRIGWQEGVRQFVLRGLPIATRNHIQFYPSFNELRCSSYHLTPETMETYRRKALQYRPQFLRCYPSSGFLFAKFIEETGREFPPLRGIMCASENLYPHQKDLLAQVFQARVFSHYGHYELSVLAGFCEFEDTYHVLPQYGYAELLHPDGSPVTNPGDVGEIVATSFIMHATPFIRYRTRDLAVFRGWKCPFCKRPYQIWDKIEGRLQEFIVTKTGRRITMTAINMHDDIFDHIRQFQFHQKTLGQIEFHYIPRKTCSSAIVDEMKRRLLVKLGDDVELILKSVRDIPLTVRGKHRFLIQKLQMEIGDA